MFKNYILDTNILLDGLTSFTIDKKDCGIIVPLIVVEELDAQKSREGELGFRARKAIRELIDIKKFGNISEWIKLNNNVSLKISGDIDYELPLLYKVNDDKILGCLSSSQKKYGKSILVSSDLNMCIKAESLGFDTEIYSSKDNYVKEMYKGYLELSLDNDIVDTFYKNKKLCFSNEPFKEYFISKVGRMPFPNEFIVGKSYSNNSFLAKYNLKDNAFVPLKYSDREFYGFRPQDVLQKFALELLLDPEVKVITLSGSQGIGKTFLALGSALELVFRDNGAYEKILVGKSTVPIDKYSYQGFTTGSTEEKLLTHFNNYLTTLENLHQNKDKGSDGLKLFNGLESQGALKILDLSSILGSSFDRKVLIVDEFEGVGVNVARSVLTRISDNCKVILIGDLRQQSLTSYHGRESGLFTAIEWLKNVDGVGHITLKKVLRGTICQQISKEYDKFLYGEYE